MRAFDTDALARRLPLLLGLAGVAAAAACRFDEVAVPEGSAGPVVHAVLNPFRAPEFTLLLERTLGGRVATTGTGFDPLDPVVAGGGEPITGARVVIHDETLPTSADSAVGIELASRRTDGRGRGVYVFENFGCTPFYCPTNGVNIRRGGSYRLVITTPLGEQIEGQTQVPIAYASPDTLFARPFDASRDTYLFRWPAAETLQRYAVQIQTPYGPFQTFSAVESLAVSGTLRNFQLSRFPRVFVPGFRQTLQALAVDRNYFDFYRSENNAFTGLGLVSSVAGGTGVFGAIHPIRTQFLDVTGPFDDPVDGVWTLLDAETSVPPRLTTYSDGAFASGRLEDVFDPQQQTRRGVIGTRSGNTLRLAVLFDMSLRDTAWTLTAEVRGDTMVTASPEKGAQRWLRVRQEAP
jgi:hypothetical protein